MDNYKQVVGAIFVRNHQVFAAKRGDCKYHYVAHKYEFVGGKVEPGETPEVALVREVWEELGARCTVQKPYMVVQHIYPDFRIELHIFLCEMDSDYRLLEHENACWMSANQLHADEWAPADAAIIDKLKQDLQEQRL